MIQCSSNKNPINDMTKTNIIIKTWIAILNIIHPSTNKIAITSITNKEITILSTTILFFVKKEIKNKITNRIARYNKMW